MPTRRPSPASGTTEVRPLPPELEARIEALEQHASPIDFDAWSWFWMLLLGAVLPTGLLIVGWYYVPGAS
jgi:hypothetical protein